MEDLGKSAYPPEPIAESVAEQLRINSEYGKRPPHRGYPTIPPIPSPFKPTIDVGHERVTINGPEDETYDLVVICRYITQMHGMLVRLEPVINDLTDFAEFMREFKTYAKEDLAKLTTLLDKEDDEESEDDTDAIRQSDAEESALLQQAREASRARHPSRGEARSQE